MRIAQVAPINHQISPDSNYGIYSNVGYICDGLVEAGHDVTLFASKDALTKATIKGVVEQSTRSADLLDKDVLHLNHLNLSKCFQEASNFELIHSHYSTLGTLYAPLVDVPVVHSVHNPLPPSFLDIKDYVKGQKFISFSLAQRKQYPDLNWVANIYHGIDPDTYTFSETSQGYLLYLGRVIKEKGAHIAIEAAKAAGKKLIISGMSRSEEEYWHKEIEPHVNGVDIHFVGPSDMKKKIELFQGADALLFPTRRNEPFGLVMIEAMSCGTPVIGFNDGAVSEVVQDGVTGFVVDSTEEMIAAIGKVHTLKRTACRERVKKLFSVEKMVQGYLNVYERIINDWKQKHS
jgi:glycosyltransferase involved in cell wall biosynthesis